MTRLRTRPCGQQPQVQTLWSAASGPDLVVSSLRSRPCGQQPQDQTLWSAASGSDLVVSSLRFRPCGQQPQVQTLWSAASGSDRQLEVLVSLGSAQTLFRAENRFLRLDGHRATALSRNRPRRATPRPAAQTRAPAAQLITPPRSGLESPGGASAAREA